MQWLKHAFGIEPASALDPSPEQIKVIDQFCEIVVRKRIIIPVTLFLETVRPLNYLGAQILHGITPFVSAFMKSDAIKELAEFLEHRGAIDFLCDRLKNREELSLKETRENDPDHPDIETNTHLTEEHEVHS